MIFILLHRLRMKIDRMKIDQTGGKETESIISITIISIK